MNHFGKKINGNVIGGVKIRPYWSDFYEKFKKTDYCPILLGHYGQQ
jgi:hypothetical protein